MMSGHGTKPIFFNENNKDWTSRTLSNLHPYLYLITSHNISFLPQRQPPPPRPPYSPQSGRHMCITPYIFDLEHSNNTVCLFLNDHQTKEKRNP